jgi:hypothetical protein
VWKMKIYRMDTEQVTAPESWRFVNETELAALPMPTAIAKARKEAVHLLTE